MGQLRSVLVLITVSGIAFTQMGCTSTSEPPMSKQPQLLSESYPNLNAPVNAPQRAPIPDDQLESIKNALKNKARARSGG